MTVRRLLFWTAYGVLVVALLASLPAIVNAAAPEITWLSPMGVQQGSEVTVSLQGNAGELPLSVWTDDPGLSVVCAEDRKTATVTASETTPIGLHWLRIYNAEGTTAPLPCDVGTLPEIAETEPNNRLEEATTVPLPSVVNGLLHKNGEVDTFRVSLNAGDQFVASLDANAMLGTPMDSVLQVLDARGNVMLQNDDDHGRDSLLSFVAPETRDYVVRVFAFPASPDSGIRFSGADNYFYRLTLTTGPFLSGLLPTATEGALAGTGWNLDPSETRTPEAWQQVPTFQPRWVLERWTAPGVVSEEAAQGRIELDSALAGTIQHAGERDRYQISLQKGHPCQFRLSGRFAESWLDPLLTVSDQEGTVLQEWDDQFDEVDCLGEWTPQDDGEYVIEVRDRFGHGGDRYPYLLEVRPLVPTYLLGNMPPHYSIQAGQPLKIEIPIQRLQNHQGELTAQVSGLPDDITWEVTPTQAEGDAANLVTLTLHPGESVVYQGTFQIAVKPAEGESSTPVLAALRSAGAKTSQLWLTVTAAPEAEMPETTEPEAETP